MSDYRSEIPSSLFLKYRQTTLFTQYNEDRHLMKIGILIFVVL